MFETVELQIIPKGDAPVVHCSQYDTNRLIRFTIMNGDDPMTFANLVSITTTIRKVDGNLWKYEDNSPVLVSGNYDVFTDEQMTACSGNNIGELTIRYTDSDITDEDIKISTLNFILNVKLSPECGGLVSQSDISNLSGQIALIVNEQLGNYYTKSEIDDQIEDIVTEQVTPIVADIVAEQVPSAVEAALSNYYTKDETDTYFYNKTETDALLSDKANTSDLPDMDDYYTKTDTDTLLAGKVSNSALNNYYTKSEVDALVGTFDIIDTASGFIVTVNNGGNNIPVNNLESVIVADGTGFTEVNIYVTGKNLFYPLQSFTNGFINAQGEVQASASYIHTDFIKVKPETTYTTSGDVALSNTRNAIACYNSSKVFIERLSPDTAGGWTFTTPENTAYIRMNLGGAGRDLNTIQLEQGNVSTSYESFGNVYNIALGETLTQGGILNVTTGVLTRTDTTTSQLTPTAVNTLSGLNNIYSSTGDVTVTYFNDKADQIAALINVLGGN